MTTYEWLFIVFISFAAIGYSFQALQRGHGITLPTNRQEREQLLIRIAIWAGVELGLFMILALICAVLISLLYMGFRVVHLMGIFNDVALTFAFLGFVVWLVTLPRMWRTLQQRTLPPLSG